MLIKVFGAALQGIEATIVTIEVNCSKGIKFFMVGLPDAAVKEGHERIVSAMEVNGLKFPRCQVIINMSPADIKKEGASYDLPLAMGILAASNGVSSELLSRYLIMGELSLDGSVLPIRGALPMAIHAWRLGFEGMILPKANAMEAGVVKDLSVFGVGHISEVIDILNQKSTLVPVKLDVRKIFAEQHTLFDFDFSDVKGQESVKRALEVAAAGSHNFLLCGPPGSGKSMMAKRLPSILPPLTLEEALETTKIHSVAGKICGTTSLITQRPFRSPHHNISVSAMTGGGSFPKPGEISLAHNGVLFLDEMPEFNRNVLEVMRQPLEDRTISISRTRFSVEYPAGFMLAASMNPCPCGYYNHPTHACTCSSMAVKRYLQHLSGPLLDRIDIQIEIAPVPFEKLSSVKEGEKSEIIRARVAAAREIQSDRYKNEKGIYSNAQMTPSLLKTYGRPDAGGLQLLKVAMERFNLSARAYDRILKVARTIADLERTATIESSHVAEAINYRNLDREGWGS